MKKTGLVSSASCGDPMIKLTLMQCFELHKELEVKRRKLEKIKQKRLTLKAEVRFLSRRFKDLKQHQALETSPVMLRLSKSGDLEVPSKPCGKRKNPFGLRASVPCVDLKQKNTICSEKEALSTSASCDLEKKLKRSTSNEVLTNTLPDIYRDGNTSVANKVLGFDLNQISIEEEEPKADGENMVAEASKNTMLGNGMNDLHEKRKLPIHRDVEKESNRRVKKRKVSWQDPVALMFHSPKRTYANEQHGKKL